MDLPEEDRFSLPDCDIVHHSVVRLRIPLATDGQPCGHKKQNPQTEQKCVFGEGDKDSAQRHRFEAEEEKKRKKKDPHSRTADLRFTITVPGQIIQSSPNPNPLQVAARCAQTRPCRTDRAVRDARVYAREYSNNPRSQARRQLRLIKHEWF